MKIRIALLLIAALFVLCLSIVSIMAPSANGQTTSIQWKRHIRVEGIPAPDEMVYLFKAPPTVPQPPVNNFHTLPWTVPPGKVLVLTGITPFFASGVVTGAINFNGTMVLMFTFSDTNGSLGTDLFKLIPPGVVAPAGTVIDLSTSGNPPIVILGYLADN